MSHVTQPMPTGNGESVPAKVLELLDNLDYRGFFTPKQIEITLPIIIKGIKERDAFGKDKYGTSLRVNNGRDPVIDSKEELLDAFQYITQAAMEDKLTKEVVLLCKALSFYADRCKELQEFGNV